MKKVVPVLLCGGSGSRLWPLSRNGFPKQFLSLFGEKTLFQETCNRFSKIEEKGIEQLDAYFILNKDHKFLAFQQLIEIGLESSCLIVEPSSKNTAAALTLAALNALDDNGDSLLLVTPTDHVVKDNESFSKSIQFAIGNIKENELFLFGVNPDSPKTGFGYIKVDDNKKTNGIFEILEFKEKPNKENAEIFLSEGNYFWNAGIFLLKASLWISLIEKYRPDIFLAVKNCWLKRKKNGAFIDFDEDEFSKIPNDSIDYAVIEPHKCDGGTIKMMNLNCGWSDVGSWDSVWENSAKDAEGNCLNNSSYTLDSKNNFVFSEKMVALVGVNDIVAIDTPDALLICNKDNSQRIKDLISNFSKKDLDKLSLHRKVHRPWGWYDSIDNGDRFKVKRILVNPKASLSLQQHHHRAEHWIVVKGTAIVENGNQKILLSENESTYIPLGAIHRLTNPGAIPLELIEIQTGSYLGEDDIVRFEDVYGRLS